jgi:hypothetical protein
MADSRKVKICPEETDKNHNEKTHKFKQLFKGKNIHMFAFLGFMSPGDHIPATPFPNSYQFLYQKIGDVGKRCCWDMVIMTMKATCICYFP